MVDHSAHGVDLPEDVASIEAIMRRQQQHQKQQEEQEQQLLATAAARPLQQR